MDPASEATVREPLVLALSRIHRSRNLEQLRQVFLNDIPRLIPADAYGLYLFDDQTSVPRVFAHRADPRFLSEYELQRLDDPLLRNVLERKRFTHSLQLYSEADWTQLPLYDLLTRWGLAYTIESPLIANGTVVGTVNIATGNKAYFSAQTLAVARFLCQELDVCCRRLLELEALRAQAAPSEVPNQLSARARDVMTLAAAGLSNRAIADELGISENTVRYHIKRIYRELGVRNRAQLAQRQAALH